MKTVNEWLALYDVLNTAGRDPQKDLMMWITIELVQTKYPEIDNETIARVFEEFLPMTQKMQEVMEERKRRMYDDPSILRTDGWSNK
jgi:hypothetical protein